MGAQCQYESGSQIQDASFIGLIVLPAQCHNDYQVNLRISHFGNFAGWSDDTALKPEYLELVNHVLYKQGYIYIPTYILEKRYTSKNLDVTWIHTWWTRYFDYL